MGLHFATISGYTHRDTHEPVLTGEIKMPGSTQGGHPLNADLVDDALQKAFRAGVRYCFTWNVRQFVLFDSHIQRVPFTQRHIEGPTNVADVLVSDDVNRQWAHDAIREFWKQFLDRFADLLAGRRPFQLAPIDQRFIGWIEGALEAPIANTSQILGTISSDDPSLKRSKRLPLHLTKHCANVDGTSSPCKRRCWLGSGHTIKAGNHPHETSWSARTWNVPRGYPAIYC